MFPNPFLNVNKIIRFTKALKANQLIANLISKQMAISLKHSDMMHNREKGK